MGVSASPGASTAPGGSGGSAGARHAGTGRHPTAPGARGLQGGGVQPPALRDRGGTHPPEPPRPCRPRGAGGSLGLPARVCSACRGTHTVNQLAPHCIWCPGLSCALAMQAEPRARGARPAGGDAPCLAEAAAAASVPPRLGS